MLQTNLFIISSVKLGTPDPNDKTPFNNSPVAISAIKSVYLPRNIETEIRFLIGNSDYTAWYYPSKEERDKEFLEILNLNPKSQYKADIENVFNKP